MPLSRRRVDLESLKSIGGTPIYSSNKHQSAALISDDSPIGICINQWEITTHNSSIGDEQGMESLTLLLEDLANSTTIAKDKRRRLCPPEITFLAANISLKYNTTEIRFNATDALMEWAEAHKYLNYAFEKYDDKDTSKEYRGVQVLQTKDAKMWSEKSSENNTTEFYYDWTFATPYAGTIQTNMNDEASNNTPAYNRRIWKSHTQSPIPIHLLQDTSQPILLYDDISLFEDDLHDNGDVSLNIKIRVMPTCWYVLQRLFVRVDHVCLKVREVRMFCYFGDDVGAAALGIDANTVFRDVCWREASWEDLLKLGLPTDPARWRCDGENVAGVNQLILRLPRKELPSDLYAHSSVCLKSYRKG
ncbi:hypothetical protein ACHAWO_011290 [Cyclotella atomus]|uniref:TIP41-like protein n=1 Tax=Cyclotella atomus TaxID=382360 RepID=A0ABD3N5C8_9STRA